MCITDIVWPLTTISPMWSVNAACNRMENSVFEYLVIDILALALRLDLV